MTGLNDLTPSQLTAMRTWLAGGRWETLTPQDVTRLTDREVLAWVAAHHAGGIAGFLEVEAGKHPGCL